MFVRWNILCYCMQWVVWMSMALFTWCDCDAFVCVISDMNGFHTILFNSIHTYKMQSQLNNFTKSHVKNAVVFRKNRTVRTRHRTEPHLNVTSLSFSVNVSRWKILFQSSTQTAQVSGQGWHWNPNSDIKKSDLLLYICVAHSVDKLMWRIPDVGKGESTKTNSLAKFLKNLHENERNWTETDTNS